jgi:hypothetical protein
MSADRVVPSADIAAERALQLTKIIIAFALVLSFSVGAEAGVKKHHHTYAYAYAYGNGYNPYGYYNPFNYYPGEYHWCGMGYFERHGGCDALF